MPNAIEISHIAVSSLAPAEITPTMARSEVEWYTLEVSVENTSATPLYAISEIRHIHYDAGKRLLIVELSEPDAPESRAVVDLPTPPSYSVVEPGERATLASRLSSPITWVEESPEGQRRPVHVRFGEDVDAVECIVAYNAEPPARVDLTAIESPAPSPGWAVVSDTASLG
jgi:hypothetical protein